MSRPPNMQSHEYDRLQDLRKRTATLTPNESKDLQYLNGLSISHLQFNYPARVRSDKAQKPADFGLFNVDKTGELF